MTITVQLLVSEWCAPCRGAEEVWRGVAQKKSIVFEVLDVGQPEGRTIVSRLGVKTVPSTIIDGTLKHLGVPTAKEALELVSAAPDRAEDESATHYVGLTLEATSGWAIAFGFIGVALASVNIFGGFVVTHRMLSMFKKRQ